MNDPREAASDDRGADLAAACALVALVFLAFSPSLRGAWLWDDDANVTTRAVVQRLGGIVDIWTNPRSTQQFYPLTHTSFWLEWQIFGGHPFYFHALNVALHAATAVVVWRTLRAVMDRGAWLAAALFAVHPVQVESVAWITERKNVLAGLLAALALWAYVRGRSRVLTAACFVLALAAKSAVAPLPFVMLVAGELRRRRQEGGACDAHAFVRAFVGLLPLFALGLGAGLVTAHLENASVGAFGPEFDWPPLKRVFVACHAVWFYPQKLVAPFPLAFEYPLWDVDPSHAAPWCFVFLTVVTASVLVVLRRMIPWGVHAAVLAYVALIFPALGIFNVFFMRYAYAQDHFQYFACAPLLALVAWCVVRVAEAQPMGARAFALFLVAGCVALSVKRSYVFRSNESLFGDAIAANPEAWHPYAVLAHDARERGDTATLVTYLEHVTGNRPSDWVFQDALGRALLQEGRPRDAVGPLRRATEENRSAPASKQASSYLELGRALEAAGDCTGARGAYESGSALAPGWAPISQRLAFLLATCPATAVPPDGAGR